MEDIVQPVPSTNLDICSFHKNNFKKRTILQVLLWSKQLFNKTYNCVWARIDKDKYSDKSRKQKEFFFFYLYYKTEESVQQRIKSNLLILHLPSRMQQSY